MKKIAYMLLAMLALANASCSDLLDIESTSQLDGPDIGNKTDSVYYAFGVMAAMQQLGDTYVLQNELRGDLVNTTSVTDNNLRRLFNFQTDQHSAYDSAYVYYKVINNVNYYLAHVDTTLTDGATNLVINQYAAMKAFRAWAYLQAVRQYGQVKYVTRPLTAVSEVEDDNSPVLGLEAVCTNLIDDLRPYSGMSVPSHGTIDCGSGNNTLAGSKSVDSWRSYIPVDIMLGELYLERAAATGNADDYMQAAHYYYTYIDNNDLYTSNLYGSSFFGSFSDQPSDFGTGDRGNSFTSTTSPSSWSLTFNNNSSEVISQIPFAQNYMRGTTTNLPAIWGINYYTANADSVATASTIQLVPSRNIHAISDSTDVYYYSEVAGYTSVRAADARLNDIYANAGRGIYADSLFMTKFNTANVILYRKSTVWLHLAEALNGAGYPDAAFAVLKSGLKPNLLASNDTLYLRDTTKVMLTTDIPLCLSTAENSQLWNQYNVGIHGYGASYGDLPLSHRNSTYTYDSIVGTRIARIAAEYEGIAVPAGTLQDSINAVEDILCDEYAMEFAFEGVRFSDLSRMARAKNSRGNYGATFGNQWFARKMAYKQGVATDLSNPNNWYLKFR